MGSNSRARSASFRRSFSRPGSRDSICLHSASADGLPTRVESAGHLPVHEGRQDRLTGLSLRNEPISHGHGRAHDDIGWLHWPSEFVATPEAEISRRARENRRTAVGRDLDDCSKTPAERRSERLSIATSLRKRFTIALSPRGISPGRFERGRRSRAVAGCNHSNRKRRYLVDATRLHAQNVTRNEGRL